LREYRNEMMIDDNVEFDLVVLLADFFQYVHILVQDFTFLVQYLLLEYAMVI